MEFLRIARDESYHQIVLSMKSSNPLVMVQAYRLLVRQMQDEFGECYPLHLGVTEAGDGEDGRIKSAIGIGTLLEEGIGDTIRVSLTEDPEFELPVCSDIVARIASYQDNPDGNPAAPLPYNRFAYSRRKSIGTGNIGATHVPVVVADFMYVDDDITPESLAAIGYHYEEALDKWHIGDAAADFVYTNFRKIDFALPGTLGVICNAAALIGAGPVPERHYPLYEVAGFEPEVRRDTMAFVSIDANAADAIVQAQRVSAQGVVLCIHSSAQQPMLSVRRLISTLTAAGNTSPVIIVAKSHTTTVDKQLIDLATDSGALLLDGMGDGVWLMNDPAKLQNAMVTGRTYLPVSNNEQFLNNTAFSILQATRTRISKTEYISCPSCGRTLFDLQETTAKIRAATSQLKGVKIAIMGCIVNGPGEMADADFGYVGSGPGKITLYQSKEVVKKNVPSEIAVQELINLLKDAGAWQDVNERVV
jgi:(E)-4-hydroxy-3-methylbut-2-enyl-diphosphate synthase